MLPPGILRRVDGGFVVHEKDDGGAYWEFVKACIEENIDQDALLRGLPAKPDIVVSRSGVSAVLRPIVFINPKRMVFRAEWGGRVFILKRAFTGTVGLRRIFPRMMGVTHFTRVMKLVDAAVRRGCRSTQGYCLVAERRLSAFRQEVWLLLEYVEGRPIALPELPARREALADAVDDLLAHGLTMDDLSPGNFLFDSPDGVEGVVRAIDVSCRPFAVLQAAKMRVKLNALYGLGIPARGLGERVCAWLLRARYWVRGVFGGERY